MIYKLLQDIQHGEIVMDEVFLATKRFLENITKHVSIFFSCRKIFKDASHIHLQPKVKFDQNFSTSRYHENPGKKKLIKDVKNIYFV